MNDPLKIPVPAGLAAQPKDAVRGLHVPFFVSWIDGKPEWRCADGAKRTLAIRQKLCWVCGLPLAGDTGTRRQTFILGPMCVVSHTTAEPPCHHECALYSVMVCPFLSRPAMDRREAGRPEGTVMAGMLIMRNPGVSVLWTTNGYRLFSDGKGGVLLRVNGPLAVAIYREGRTATRGEIEESFTSGLPILEAACQGDLEELAALREQVGPAQRILGIAPAAAEAWTQDVKRQTRARCPGHEQGGGTPCCPRAGEYNGFGSDGPLLFTCPKGCGCHD